MAALTQLTDPNKRTSLQQFGYDQQTGEALARSLNLTTDQLLAALNTTPANIKGAGGTNQYGASSGAMVGTQDTGSTIQQLKLMQAVGNLGGGNQGSQGGQAGTFASGPVDYSGSRAAENLGAMALGRAGFSGAQGAFPVYNPIPGPAQGKGGVGNIGSPVVANAIPTGPTPNVAGVLGQPSQEGQGLQYWQQHGGGGSAADAAALEKAQGWAPGTIAKQFYQAGVQQGAITPQNPAPTAGGTPTPMMPANAAAAARPVTPFATAPPAPGVDVMAAHNTALENAGKALFAHFGGDPSTATHADIANFHSQLTGALGTAIGGGQVPGSNFTAGVNQPPSALQPAKMATGGLVPGRGNQDTVPALLTPGEYVIPKQQATQMFGGRAPVRMASGGFVPEDDDETPPEVRRKRLTVRNAPAATQQGVQPGQGSQSSTPAPAAPGVASGGIDWNQIAQARAVQQANQGWNAMGTNAYQAPVGSSAMTVGDVGANTNIPGAGQTQSLGQLGGGAGAGAASAVGGLMSGLQQAADAYKKSIGSWNWQPQQFSSAPSAPSGPAAQFTQEDVDQQKKKKDAMLIAQYGYNPTSG